MSSVPNNSFPKIDRPCPLSAEEQRAIDGHCDRCNKHVHALDGLSETERRRLLAAATGPICVSYQLPVPRKVGRFGAAIAATLITTSAAAYAQDNEPAGSALPPTPNGPTWVQTRGDESTVDVGDIMVLGGVDDPQNAALPEDTSVPELPMRAAEPQQSPVQTQAVVPDETLDRITIIGGGVSDPANAQWEDAEDIALPELPMIVTGPESTDGHGR